MLPAIATTRPSPSFATPGYQRAKFNEERSDHPVAVSKAFTAGMPVSAPLWPPTTSSLPSASCTWPEQKICVVWLGMGVNAPVLGFQTVADAVPPVSHASHNRTLPVGRRDAWTASSGQFVSGPHWPTWLGSLATRRLAGIGTTPDPAAGSAVSASRATSPSRPTAASRRPAPLDPFTSRMRVHQAPGRSTICRPRDRPPDLGMLRAGLRMGGTFTALGRHERGPADMVIQERGSHELERLEGRPVRGRRQRQARPHRPPGPRAVAAREQDP